MASKALSKMTLLLSLNLFFFTLVSSHYVPCPPPPKSSKPPPIKPQKSPKTPPIKPPTSPSPPKSPKTRPIKPPISPSPPKSHKSPPIKPPTPSPPKKAYCPNDALKLGVCANLLNDLVNVIVGTPAKTPCCSLLGGLADLDAAVCLCTAIKANVLGINLNVPVSLSLLLNYCGKSVPSDYTCDA